MFSCEFVENSKNIFFTENKIKHLSSISYMLESQDASSFACACCRGNNLTQFPSQKSGQTWKKNWQGSQLISCKSNFSQRNKMHLADHTHKKKTKKKLTKISGRKLRSDTYLHPKLTNINIHLTTYTWVIFLQNSSFDFNQKKS